MEAVSIPMTKGLQGTRGLTADNCRAGNYFNILICVSGRATS